MLKPHLLLLQKRNVKLLKCNVAYTHSHCVAALLESEIFEIGCCFQGVSVCAGSPLFVGSPLKNFHAPWGKPFTLLRNIGLSYHMQLQKHVYWSDFQESTVITRLKDDGPTSPNRQDTDVSKHLTNNPDHKIDFDETEIMAQTNHWRKLSSKH